MIALIDIIFNEEVWVYKEQEILMNQFKDD